MYRIDFKRVTAKIARHQGVIDFIKTVYDEIKMTLIRPLIINSWSAYNEDVIIDKLLNNKDTGFYIDVGAYDSWVGSNTRRFYGRGWRGLNIEPEKERYEKISSDRKYDINVHIGAGDKKGELTFFVMSPKQLSTFSEIVAKRRIAGGFKLTKKEKVPVDTVSNIYLKFAKDKEIDFMSIDTEGYEYVVLKGIDWAVLKPRVLCIEKTEKEMRAKIDDFLLGVGYDKVAETVSNDIFSCL